LLRVGLTGGIGCGKSVVRGLLGARGAFTIDADEVVHELLGPGTETSRQVAEAFGSHFLTSVGAVDRKALGALVFSSPEARARLNAIVHPRVFERLKELLEEAEERGERVAVVDAALMIETGSYKRYDRVVVVYCPREMQLERLKARDGLTDEEARLRVDAQMPIEEKKEFADYVVDNRGTLVETERQVDAVWRKLQSGAAA